MASWIGYWSAWQWNCELCEGYEHKRRLYGCRGPAEIPIEIGGVVVGRCPHAVLRDLTEGEAVELRAIHRLAIARCDGILSPYPGDYSGRTLDLIDVMVRQSLRAERESAREEARAK